MLRRVASVCEYELSIRERAIEVLISSLRNAGSIEIRSVAVELIEMPSIRGISAAAQKAFDWWSRRRQVVRGMPILLSDDDESVLISHKVILKTQGWSNLLTASDADATLALAEREQPALIITDLRKPRMTGFEMAKRLRRNATTENIPMVMVSAVANPLGRPLNETNLFCTIFEKPVDVPLLTRAVEIILSGPYAD